jgi:hypothetical protein
VFDSSLRLIPFGALQKGRAKGLGGAGKGRRPAHHTTEGSNAMKRSGWSRLGLFNSDAQAAKAVRVPQREEDEEAVAYRLLHSRALARELSVMAGEARRRVTLAILAALALAAATPLPASGATEYFVNNSSPLCEKTIAEGCGTKEKPWNTIKKAAEEVKPDSNVEYTYINVAIGTGIYKEGTVRLKNGVVGKSTLDFLGEARWENPTCTIFGPHLERCPKVEGEFIFEAPNTIVVVMDVEKSTGPCFRVNGGLTKVGSRWTESINCKSEAFANWFNSELFKEQENNYAKIDAGALKMRPDTKEENFKEKSERENSTWFNAHTSMLRGYTCCIPTPFQTTGGAELLEPVTAYYDWPAYESKYAPLQISTTRRENFVKEKVESDARAKGYMGVILDDVNWTCGIRDQYEEGTTDKTRQAELKTKYGEAAFNEKYSETACANRNGKPELEEERELVKATRTALGAGGILEFNSHDYDVWPLLKVNSEGKCGLSEEWKKECELVEAAIKEANLVTLEFGLSESTKAGFEHELKTIEREHELGAGVVFATKFNFPTSPEETVKDEYQLAGYFLVNEGRDYVTSWSKGISNLWPGLAKLSTKSLGTCEARTEDTTTHVYKRKCERGVAYLDPPGGSSTTITRPAGMESVEWGTGNASLTAGRGAVYFTP